MEVKTTKNKALWLVLGIILALAVLAGLYYGVRAIVNASKESSNPTSISTSDPTVNTTVGAQPSENGNTTEPITSENAGTPSKTESPEITAVRAKKVYTEDNLSADDPSQDETIATCGDYTVNSRDAQVFFAMQYYGFMNNYGDWAIYFGLDASQPLSEQLSTVSDLSWEQYFLMAGMDDFHNYAALATRAKSEGYTMEAGEEAQLSEVRDGLMERFAEAGYDSADSYVQANFGTSVRYEDYVRYLELYFYAMSYQNSLYRAINPEDSELESYFDEHPDFFVGIGKDQTNVNVRHILISVDVAEDAPQADVKEAKDAAKAKAEALLAEYRQNPTEEHFAELARANTEDPGSQENGGLYEDVYPGQMVEEFNDWCFDEARKPGDTDIVETSFGYHIMYFVQKTDDFYWKVKALEEIRSDRMFDVIEELTTAYPMTTFYEKAVLVPLPKQYTN
ncbi:MAG: peptidylprolyl isomerase [Oscillospiraceae bacterium]|nr:peptidylprolyl isomerase [Oscillospiraceae bacterium]